MISHSEIEIKTLEISNHQTFLSVLEKKQKIFIYTILDYQDNIKERFENHIGMIDIIGMYKIDVVDPWWRPWMFMANKFSAYPIDFFWVCKSLEVNGEIKEPRPIVSFQGTMTYAAVNAHNKVELGRQDDLYSLFYIILEFIKGIQSCYIGINHWLIELFDTDNTATLVDSFTLKVVYRGVIWKKKKKLDHSSQQ